MNAATSDSWKTQPMPEQVATLHYSASFTQAEFDLISVGLVPKEMEDKWFIFLHESTLHLHRSWTGACMYEVDLERIGSGYLVREARVNRRSEQYASTDDLYDAKLLHFLIANLLLGHREPFPAPTDGMSDGQRALFQHHISGTSHADAPVRKKPRA